MVMPFFCQFFTDMRCLPHNDVCDVPEFLSVQKFQG